VIVVDCNVVVPLVVHGPNTAVVERLYHADADWFAPTLMRYELRNTLVRYCRRGLLAWPDAAVLAAEAELQIGDPEYHASAAAILIFARDSGCTAYDSEYAVLAEGLDLPLLTWDRKLLAALPDRAVTPEEFLARR
jgi:predicted nucleic acid-binding protein